WPPRYVSVLCMEAAFSTQETTAYEYDRQDECANRATHIDSTRPFKGSRRSGTARPLHESTTSRGNEHSKPDTGRSDETEHFSERRYFPRLSSVTLRTT